MAIGPPYPSVAPTVAADVPAVALGLVSLALLAWAYAAGRPELERGSRCRARAGGDDEAPGGAVRGAVPGADPGVAARPPVLPPQPCGAGAVLAALAVAQPARSTRSGSRSSVTTPARQSSAATGRTRAGSATCSSRARRSPGWCRRVSSAFSPRVAPDGRGRCGRLSRRRRCSCPRAAAGRPPPAAAHRGLRRVGRAEPGARGG